MAISRYAPIPAVCSVWLSRCLRNPCLKGTVFGISKGPRFGERGRPEEELEEVRELCWGGRIEWGICMANACASYGLCLRCWEQTFSFF